MALSSLTDASSNKTFETMSSLKINIGNVKIIIKIFKTIILFVFCVVSFICVVLYNVFKALFKNAPQQDSKPISTPVMGTPAGAVNYSKHGLPQEIGKTGDGISQNDYENLRKVL